VSERPLWAPWRIEYITGAKAAECIFCAAAAGDGDPARRVVERGTRCLTMLNAFPYAPGHLMVAPRRHVAALDELEDDELLELMQLAQRATRALRSAMTPDGFNVGLNLGKVAGAGIADHMHWHVVPRWDGDTNFMPVLASTRVLSQDLESSFDTLAPLFETIARN